MYVYNREAWDKACSPSCPKRPQDGHLPAQAYTSTSKRLRKKSHDTDSQPIAFTHDTTQGHARTAYPDAASTSGSVLACASSARRAAGSEGQMSPLLSPFATAPSQLPASRARAAAVPRELARLPFFICLNINRYLAKDATAHWLHRVAGGGPVAYVFLGHAHATSFLGYLTRDLVSLVQLPGRLTTLPTPLPHMEAEATSAHRTPTDHEMHQEDAPQQQCKPVSALILKDEWLEMILSGRKTWEIQNARTTKRERVALALSGTPLLLGDIDIGGVSSSTVLPFLQAYRNTACHSSATQKWLADIKRYWRGSSHGLSVTCRLSCTHDSQVSKHW